MAAGSELARFVTAQDGVWHDVIGELRAGRKETHWMWFVFPQIDGLGRSEIARRYALLSLEEARAYLADPVLGGRLRHCTDLVNGIEGRSAHAIFGAPDDMKFRSSMTLFAAASPVDECFPLALDKYFDGKGDAQTMSRL